MTCFYFIAPPSSAYAAPRVIPIQYIGPATPNTSSPTLNVNSHPQPAQYASVSAGALRRPGAVSTPSPTNQSSMVSAARNYVSNVVAAVTNAATNNSLLAGGISGTRRGQPTAVSPSAAGTSPLREQWSYAAQATSSPSPASNDTGGYRAAPPPSASVNAHRAGVAASVYSASQQQQSHQSQPQQPAGSVTRKAPPRTAASATAGQQQVSEDGAPRMDVQYVSEAGQRQETEPEIAQLQAVINSMAGTPGPPNAPPPYSASSHGNMGPNSSVGRLGSKSRRMG